MLSKVLTTLSFLSGLCYAFPIPVQNLPAFKYEQIEISQLDPKAHWIVTADFNNDGRPDIVSIGFADASSWWFENTNQGFLKHPLTSLSTVIHMDVGDINEDGFIDIIVAHNWDQCFMHCTEEDGRIVWLENPGKSYDQEWKAHTIVDKFGTGVHRVNYLGQLRNGDIAVLSSGMVGADSRQSDFLDKPASQRLYYRPALDKLYSSADWNSREISNSLHLVHETYPSLKETGSIIAASYEGINKIDLSSGLHTTLIPNHLRPSFKNRAGWISSLAFQSTPIFTEAPAKKEHSEFFASIEPLHGNQLVMYNKNKHGEFQRTLIDERHFLLANEAVGLDVSHHVYEHGGHDVKLMDIDCDGQDEMLVAWRGSESISAKGFFVYKLKDGKWHGERIIHASFNNFAIADYDGDGINDIAISGWGTAAEDHRVVVLLNREENCARLNPKHR